MKMSGVAPGVLGRATWTSIGWTSKDGTRVATEPSQKRVPSDCAAHGILPKAVGSSALAAAGRTSTAAMDRTRRRGRMAREPILRGSVHLKRVIPCLDVDGGRVVKGTNFVNLRDAGDPVELAERYDAEGADELIFLDITATHEERDTIVDLARRTAENVFIPFTIGGGIRSVADAQAVLDAGADKISVNSAAVERPELVSEMGDRLGAQCVVLAIDARSDGNGSWEVFVAGGRTPTGRDAIEWAREGVERGAGEIMLTSMDRDGTEDGYDLALTHAVSEAVSVPVIASGGAGTLDHLVEALQAGADAALAASIFHYGTYSIAQAKARLAQAGVPVREPTRCRSHRPDRRAAGRRRCRRAGARARREAHRGDRGRGARSSWSGAARRARAPSRGTPRARPARHRRGRGTRARCAARWGAAPSGRRAAGATPPSTRGSTGSSRGTRRRRCPRACRASARHARPAAARAAARPARASGRRRGAASRRR